MGGLFVYERRHDRRSQSLFQLGKGKDVELVWLIEVDSGAAM